MKYIKAYENQLKRLSKDNLNRIEITSPYLIENKTDDNYYKVTEKSNNWYYKIKFYYREPGYVNYCFLTNDHIPNRSGWQMSKLWIEEDKLLKPTDEEILEYEMKLNSRKYNL